MLLISVPYFLFLQRNGNENFIHPLRNMPT